MEKFEPSDTGNVKRYKHFENSVAVPQMIEHVFTISSYHPFHGYIPKEIKTYSHTQTLAHDNSYQHYSH